MTPRVIAYCLSSSQAYVRVINLFDGSLAVFFAKTMSDSQLFGVYRTLDYCRGSGLETSSGFLQTEETPCRLPRTLQILRYLVHPCGTAVILDEFLGLNWAIPQESFPP